MAMIAAMRAREQVAFTPIPVPVEPASTIVQLGDNGALWSSKTLLFGDAHEAVDPQLPQQHAHVVCPFSINVPPPESRAITTALALVAAGHLLPPQPPSIPDSTLARKWPLPRDTSAQLSSSATLVICAKLLLAQRAAEAYTMLDDPHIVVTPSLAILNATPLATLAAAHIVLVDKNVLQNWDCMKPQSMAQHDPDCKYSHSWIPRKPSAQIPYLLRCSSKVFGPMACEVPHECSEIAVDGARQLQQGHCHTTQNSLYHIHWRRIIAHKVPWSSSALRPILPAFSADAWLSIAPTGPLPPGHDPNQIPLAHIQATIAGTMLSDQWQGNLPAHALEHVAPTLVLRCASTPPLDASPVPPIKYSEIPVYLTQAETAVASVGLLVDPADDRLAVRVVQHHLMTFFGQDNKCDYGGLLSSEHPERFWMALSVSRSQRLLGLSADCKEPFSTSALQQYCLLTRATAGAAPPVFYCFYHPRPNRQSRWQPPSLRRGRCSRQETP
ncbi:hypothetical protein BC828DRAFT_276947 [Blastocladiella britannica]|nr:hypothetical protein BC828DRAFT_276947 [Blastocladiella britannica]